ncbi:MAG TPA: putative peptidoglycan glycosyltransferase FtsW [Candidatus Sulfopaludibacter sp.]|jgi:cell division protein FtsW|nr:putative peptidoglycan glycosyltransferase FtsW [Candidatus Sulfopaludibacter sp.]
MALRLKTDWILFVTVLVMVFFGALFIYSASSISGKLDPRYLSSWHFVIRQSQFAVVSLLVMMGLKKMSYRKFQQPAVAFGAIGIALMLLVAAFVFDSSTHRWLRFKWVQLQPSEFAKLALVVFLAFFVTWRARAINNPRHTLIPAALAVGLVIFVVVRADLGTAVVLGILASVVFVVAGLEWRYVAIAAFVAMIGVLISVWNDPYRMKRVVQFFDPDLKILARIDPGGHIKTQLEKSLTTKDTTYQLAQSKIAVGAGGPLGVGLMNGKQKLLYLPEAHTDFIYAVVGEETGLIGTVGLLIGFGIIFWRGLRTTVRIKDDFGRYLALGVTVVVVVQGFINMSVVIGMGPTKGIPLPMISYGGSSLLSTLAMLGILMNVSEHAG